MKVLAVGVWMFINMTILGVIGYCYILWSQYMNTALERQKMLMARAKRMGGHPAKWAKGNNTFFQQINSPCIDSNNTKLCSNTNKDSVFQGRIDLNNIAPIPLDKIASKVTTYKNQLIVQLRQAQLDAGNVLFDKNKEKNPYRVKFKGQRPRKYKSSEELVCDYKRNNKISMLMKGAEPFRRLGFDKHFPSIPFEEAFGYHNTCAVISSAGSLYKSALGNEIDSHDAVLRFNSAPTENYEADVGSKTTIRIINSQVISNPEFAFFDSQLYRNVTLIVWDPSSYDVDMEKWYNQPDFDLFTPYWLRREMIPNEPFYILNPKSVWDAWNFIQRNTPVPVHQNPPSSGFLGLLIMMSCCNMVDMYEYVPSMRLTKRCHYFDVHEDMGCTFGGWHPLASEKLLVMAMNVASDVDVFVSGKVTINGTTYATCPET